MTKKGRTLPNFSMHFLHSVPLGCWRGEFDQQSGTPLVGDHFLYSHNLMCYWGVILLGEISCWSFLRVKGLRKILRSHDLSSRYLSRYFLQFFFIFQKTISKKFNFHFSWFVSTANTSWWLSLPLRLGMYHNHKIIECIFMCEQFFFLHKMILIPSGFFLC